MEIHVDNQELVAAVDKIMALRGYVPKEQIEGRTITIKEFAEIYCKPHGVDWVKNEIFYKFNPPFVKNIHPGRGKGFTIFEDEAAVWMRDHREEIKW